MPEPLRGLTRYASKSLGDAPNLLNLRREPEIAPLLDTWPPVHAFLQHRPALLLLLGHLAYLEVDPYTPSVSYLAVRSCKCSVPRTAGVSQLLKHGLVPPRHSAPEDQDENARRGRAWGLALDCCERDIYEAIQHACRVCIHIRNDDINSLNTLT